MTVSVIIVTYNTLQMTKECIDSICEKTYGVDYEIILVDNASTDGSKEFFQSDSRIKYLYSETNQGFGRANNLGMTKAAGKYVLFLNSDTLLLNNAVYEFWQWMESQPEKIGCVGCMLLDANDRPVNSFQDRQSTWYFLRNILSWYHIRIKPKYNSKVLPTLEYPRKVGFVVGADMFVRRTCLERSGLFDPDFFMYYEETELQHRFNRNGYECWCINTPHIKHLVGKSGSKTANKTSQRRFIGQLESRYLYLRKTHNIFHRYFIYLLHLLYLPILPIKKAKPGEKKAIVKILLKPFYTLL